jgi:hypothetical protein
VLIRTDRIALSLDEVISLLALSLGAFNEFPCSKLEEETEFGSRDDLLGS